MNAPATNHTFTERLFSLAAKVEYIRAEDEADRLAIFRLRYKAYLKEGAIEPNADGLFHDAHDDDLNAFLFGIRLDGRLAGSIRVHVCTPQVPVAPGLEVFADILEPYLEAGESFSDPTRFVVDPDIRGETALMPHFGLRLGSMACDHFGLDQILATVRQEHAPFYKRLFGLDLLTSPRDYPNLKKPICLMAGYMEDIREKSYRRIPVFPSTPSERASLYGPSTDRSLTMRRLQQRQTGSSRSPVFSRSMPVPANNA